jgi:FG-GAP-like repeat/Bacterial pre-peptidase C-terminal domain
MSYDTLGTAANLTLTTTLQTVTDSVSLADPWRYYRFQLTSRSQVNFTLTGLTADANLDLIQDKDGNGSLDRDDILTSSTNRETINELLTSTLDAGIYLLRVYVYDRSTSYTLAFAGTSSSEGGENALWTMQGDRLVSSAYLPQVTDQRWQLAGSGDFDRDGQVDLLWRNTATGENGIWGMNGTRLQSTINLPTVTDLNWQIVATADYDRDGQSDVLWRNPATGENVVWSMAGASFKTGAYLTPLSDRNWLWCGTGDFDQDGQLDLVWRNTVTGENALWYMEGHRLRAGVYFTPVKDVNWQIAGVVDWHGDGRSDLVWRNFATGENALWLMANTTLIAGMYLTAVTDLNWRIEGVGDFNRDRQPDLIWRNYTESPVLDAAGNSPVTAFNIGTLQGSSTFQEVVSLSDPDDYYQFNLGIATDVTLVLTNLSADANLLLANRQGTVIATSAQLGAAPEVIHQSLEPGTYYVRVFQQTGSTTYRLDLAGTATTIVPKTYRYDFTYYYNGINNTSDYYQGYIYADANVYTVGGYYDFSSQLNQIGVNGRYFIQSANMAGTIADRGKVYVERYDDVDNSGNQFIPVKYSQGAAAGTSYLGSEIDSIGSANSSDQFGNDLIEADGIFAYSYLYYSNGTNSANQDYYSGIVYALANTYTIGDYYDYSNANNEIAANGRYYVSQFQVMGNRSDLGRVTVDRYYNQENNTTYTPNGGGTNYLGTEIGWLRTPQVEVEKFGQDFYVADLVVAPNEPGNTLATAEVQMAVNFSRSQQVSLSDRDDFYRFTVNQAGIFTANLTGLSGDADVRLIQDQNNNGQIDPGEVLAWQWERGTVSEAIRKALNPGTYFLQVMSSNNQTANYTVVTDFQGKADDRRFTIDITYGLGTTNFTPIMRNAIRTAANFWESVISFSSFSGNHALTINFTGEDLGWNNGGGYLAFAGFDWGNFTPENRFLPTQGSTIVNINPDALSYMTAVVDYFTDVMIHELGHVLGIGTLWKFNQLINSNNATYNANTYAGWVYGELLGTYNQQTIPIEPQVLAHWDEATFSNELMTPFASALGTNMPASQLTLASLRDMGWQVNYGAAEAFALSLQRLQARTAATLANPGMSGQCGCGLCLSDRWPG